MKSYKERYAQAERMAVAKESVRRFASLEKARKVLQATQEKEAEDAT